MRSICQLHLGCHARNGQGWEKWRFPSAGISSLSAFPVGRPQDVLFASMRPYGDPVQERMPSEGVCTVGVAGANPALSPRNLTLQITGDKKAVLNWEAPSTPVQDTYMLVQIGGSSTALRPNVTYHEVSLSGLSCYWVFSLTRGQPVGNTDILCASQQ